MVTVHQPGRERGVGAGAAQVHDQGRGRTSAATGAPSCPADDVQRKINAGRDPGAGEHRAVLHENAVFEHTCARLRPAQLRDVRVMGSALATGQQSGPGSQQRCLSTRTAAAPGPRRPIAAIQSGAASPVHAERSPRGPRAPGSSRAPGALAAARARSSAVRRLPADGAPALRSAAGSFRAPCQRRCGTRPRARQRPAAPRSAAARKTTSVASSPAPAPAILTPARPRSPRRAQSARRAPARCVSRILLRRHPRVRRGSASGRSASASLT